MTSAKPTLGFRTRYEAIAACRAQGMTEGQIAKLIGVKPGSISSMEIRAKARADRRLIRITLSEFSWTQATREARKRKIEREEFLQKILETVFRDNLLTAVLDDL